MRIVAPSARLAPFVRDFMLVEVGEAITRTRLPELGLVLGVRYRGSASLLSGASSARMPDAVVTGIQRKARRMRTSAGGAIVLARFRPGGASQFFDRPMHELFGETVALEDLVPRSDVARAHEQIVLATSDAERVRALEALLLSRMRPKTPDPIVAAAVRAITESRSLSIRALARSLAISQDPLEKRFRRVVGASPKQLVSLLRLRRAIDAYRPGVPLIEIALTAGYYDQSHFNRAFRAATGQAPKRFLDSTDER
jgi:transcriptional regulator GlxA family with amidase domain